MQEALAGRGHTLTASEGDADAHVLVTCTVIETTERKMVRRMAELASYDKPLVVPGCMAAAQPDRVRAIVPRATLLPPRKWPDVGLGERGSTRCRTWPGFRVGETLQVLAPPGDELIRSDFGGAASGVLRGPI